MKFHMTPSGSTGIHALLEECFRQSGAELSR